MGTLKKKKSKCLDLSVGSLLEERCDHVSLRKVARSNCVPLVLSRSKGYRQHN